MPEHYVEIATKYYREQWQATRSPPELILIRRIMFRNNDQLLDFRKKKAKLIKAPVLANEVAPQVRDPLKVYDSTFQPELIKQEMIVTNPAAPSVVAHCETELIIKSVTLNRLIQKMTDPTTSTFLQDVFFDTYRSFTTPAEVFDKLCQRYEVPPLTRLGDAQRSPLDERHYIMYQEQTRLRVVQALEVWIERYYFDFAEETLYHRLTRWVREKMDQDGMPGRVQQLMRTCDRTPLSQRAPVYLPGVASRSLPPSAVLAKYHALEIANQLTLLTSFVHDRIYPCELLGRQWEGADAANVPNFIAYRDFINKVSNWVSYAVISEKNEAMRINNVTVLYHVCDELYNLNNWDALVAVHGGLCDAPVAKLTQTFDKLPADVRPLVAKYDELLSIRGASKNLKAAMAASPRPRFPSILINLRDLLHMEEMPIEAEGGGGLINFTRSIHLYNLLKFLLDGKNMKLDIVPDPALMGVFSHWAIVDESVLHTQSQQIQPR